MYEPIAGEEMTLNGVPLPTGPLHFKTAECYGSYGDFCPPKELFREDYSLLQQGLLEKPIVTKTEERI